MLPAEGDRRFISAIMARPLAWLSACRNPMLDWRIFASLSSSASLTGRMRSAISRRFAAMICANVSIIMLAIAWNHVLKIKMLVERVS